MCYELSAVRHDYAGMEDYLKQVRLWAATVKSFSPLPSARLTATVIPFQNCRVAVSIISYIDGDSWL